jgi:1-acyl-sn-glycerol-3-phosphate acyltransferase
MNVDSIGMTITPSYNHARWHAQRQVLRFLIHQIGINFLLRLDQVSGVENVPATGPAILFFNHIALVDPVVIMHCVPRNIVPLAKIEVYNYPVIGIFPKLWGVIPVKREEFDRQAVRGALDVLRAGEIMLIAPEGTRSPQMQTAKEGLAYLATRANVPLVPVGIDGTPLYPSLRGSKSWRTAGVNVRFGAPFRFRNLTTSPTREQLHQMTQEAMYAIAALLPEHRRGVYADLSQATQEMIEWL